jgi:protein phosphatase
LTDDQTYAQVLADAGQIPQSEVAFHPMAHLLTEAIGARGADIKVQIRQFTLRDGDQLLLCSDGLTRMVEDEGIAEILAFAEKPRQTCDKLIDRALQAGGLDNITVIVAKYEIPA